MYLLGNGRLVTRDVKNPFLENGCVAIEGNLIAEVGETAALRAKYPDAKFMDAKGGVIMPGFTTRPSRSTTSAPTAATTRARRASRPSASDRAERTSRTPSTSTSRSTSS